MSAFEADEPILNAPYEEQGGAFKRRPAAVDRRAAGARQASCLMTRYPAALAARVRGAAGRVEPVEVSHRLAVELEVEDLGIRADPLPVARFRDHRWPRR